jgi:mono/diheme cytochrome c family protein
MNLQKHGVKAILSAIGMCSVATLAACTAQGVDGVPVQAAASAPQHPTAGIVPGGIVREGGTIASMADQYSRPRSGAVAAAGASAWVQPAPPPAYVATGPMPAPDAPAPPPAAVANRQPSTPAPAPAADAANLARPEAAAPDAPAAAPPPDPAVRTAGLKLFNDYSCSACHALADAKAAGSIGPSLDRNPRMTNDYVVDILTNGRGAMPAFAGQMTDQQIATLAEYIVQFSRK